MKSVIYKYYLKEELNYKNLLVDVACGKYTYTWEWERRVHDGIINILDILKWNSTYTYAWHVKKPNALSYTYIYIYNCILQSFCNVSFNMMTLS